MQIILNVSTGITLSLLTYSLYGNRNVNVFFTLVLRYYSVTIVEIYHTHSLALSTCGSSNRSGQSISLLSVVRFLIGCVVLFTSSGPSAMVYLSLCRQVRQTGILMYHRA